MTRYDVEYSLDDETWVNAGTFLGPTVPQALQLGGGNLMVYNYFPSGPVLARYVKFVVQEFYAQIHLRADVILQSCSCGADEVQTAAGCVSCASLWGAGCTACDLERCTQSVATTNSSTNTKTNSSTSSNSSVSASSNSSLSDTDFKKFNYFATGPVLARYVKFLVQEFYKVIHMRADVIVQSCVCGAGEEQTAAGCVSVSGFGAQPPRPLHDSAGWRATHYRRYGKYDWTVEGLAVTM